MHVCMVGERILELGCLVNVDARNGVHRTQRLTSKEKVNQSIHFVFSREGRHIYGNVLLKDVVTTNWGSIDGLQNFIIFLFIVYIIVFLVHNQFNFFLMI